jgi:hypothetical protein
MSIFLVETFQVKLRDLSQQANYIDRVTAACLQS